MENMSFNKKRRKKRWTLNVSKHESNKFREGKDDTDKNRDKKRGVWRKQYDKEQKTNKSRKNEEHAKKPWDLMKILIKNEEDTKKVWKLDQHKLSQKTVNK